MRSVASTTAFVLAAALFCAVGHAATLTVGPGETYTTIQAAVNAASKGDTIAVKTGMYAEAIVIATNNLTLRSVDGKGRAIIVGDGSSNCVSVNAGLGVKFIGFVIDGGGLYGIYHEGGQVLDPVSVTDCTFENCSYGFYAEFSYMEGTAFTFTGNTMTDCWIGMYVYGFDGATIRISDNTATDCDNGLYVEEMSEDVPSDAIVSNNVVVSSAVVSDTYGIYCCCAEDTTKFVGNTVIGFAYGMYFEDVGCCGPSPAILYIEDNEITDCDYGLYFDELVCCMPAKVYIRGNTMSGNNCGIHVSSFNYASESTVVVTNNNICGNSFGFDNASGIDITANGNWWGDPSGPSGEGPGTGDPISVNVIVESFRSSPYTGSSGGGGGGCAAGAEGAAGLAVILPLALLFFRKERAGPSL